ncbi:LysR family transcriptional regulator [Vibrio sp. S9_S30]|uniref:LysR family transcriptional regulator n=1 Tax=Vibrio sp. S9_S30 TaxID=2720226 RepID=UPI0016810E0B|nr:LysR family transcriptional regulator [Vibrio sp. S9_S30]MBD1555895.1 LysR family transcriptional regulator [Vibrio sp. S9_S30]
MVEQHLNLRKIDLNLLPILEKLLELKHVSEAAKVLGMSQPAVSRTLNRLRELFHDPLLVRVGTRYELTAKAKALEVALVPVNRQIRGLLNQVPFEPASAEGVFTIGALDFEIMMLIPALLEKVRKEAPKLRVESMHYNADIPIHEYLEKHADLLLYSTNNCVDYVYKQRLFSDNYAVIMCNNHPLSQAPLTLESYSHAQHVIISTNGIAETSIDRKLTRLGRSRTVISAIPHFSLAPDIVANTDLIITLPTRLLGKLSPHYDFHQTSLPFDMHDFQVDQFWHSIHKQDALHKWMRDALKTVADSL